MGGSSYRFSKSLAVIKENVDVEREKYGIYFLYRTLRSVLRHLCPVHELKPRNIFLTTNLPQAFSTSSWAKRMTNEVLQIVFP